MGNTPKGIPYPIGLDLVRKGHLQMKAMAEFIDEMFDDYAKKEHSHTEYSLTSHHHDGSYAALGHSHPLPTHSHPHDHAGTYAPTAHTHPEYEGGGGSDGSDHTHSGPGVAGAVITGNETFTDTFLPADVETTVLSMPVDMGGITSPCLMIVNWSSVEPTGDGRLQVRLRPTLGGSLSDPWINQYHDVKHWPSAALGRVSGGSMYRSRWVPTNCTQLTFTAEAKGVDMLLNASPTTPIDMTIIRLTV